MIGLLASLVLAGQALPPSDVTEAGVQQTIACADGSSLGACARATEVAAVNACMRTSAEASDEVFSECLAGITDRCIGELTAGSPANRLRILTCAALSRAAMRVAIDDWLVREGPRIDPVYLDQYQAMPGVGVGRADATAAESLGDGEPDGELRASGGRTGVWSSLVRFLWRQQATLS